MGDVIGDMNKRRGRIMGMDQVNGLQCVSAEVPLGEMFKYATDLRSMTQARGSFTMQFERYEEVPAADAKRSSKTPARRGRRGINLLSGGLPAAQTRYFASASACRGAWLCLKRRRMRKRPAGATDGLSSSWARSAQRPASPRRGRKMENARACAPLPPLAARMCKLPAAAALPRCRKRRLKRGRSGNALGRKRPANSKTHATKRRFVEKTMQREILLLGDARLYQVCEAVRPEDLDEMPGADCRHARYHSRLSAADGRGTGHRRAADRRDETRGVHVP